MKTLDKNFFRRQQYTTQQLEAFACSAREDLLIAAESDYTQVKFRFSYDALIKLGILLVARVGYKVRSIPSHHVKLLAAITDLNGNNS